MNGMIFILFCFILPSVFTKHDCSSSSSILLNLYEISFFETNGFPKPLTPTEFQDCNINFVLRPNLTKHPRLIISYNQLLTSSYDSILDNNFFFVLFQSFYYVEPVYQLLPNIAMQGFVYFEEKTHDCPMESLSETTPFMIMDETQIIQINLDRYENCQWRFASPNGFGFKVNILSFSNAQFIIKNSTQVILNKRNSILGQPHYNNDNFISVSLIHGSLHVWISIVKDSFDKENNGCTTEVTKNGYIWTTNKRDYMNRWEYIGYQNNVRCLFYILIKNNTEVRVTTEWISMDEKADFVRYYLDEDHSKTIEKDFMLRPYNNGDDRYVLFEFVSDGSGVALGFYINFDIINCKCRKSFTNDGYGLTIMENTYAYCSYLRCNITIEPFFNNTIHFNVRLTSDNYFQVSDTFRVISNGITKFEINDENRHQEQFTAYLHHENTNIFEVITYPSSTYKHISLFTDYSIPSLKLNITVSSETPFYILDTAIYNFIVVKISSSLPANSTIILYSNSKPTETYFFIYNDAELTSAYTGPKCFNILDIYKCQIDKNEFAIYLRKSSYLFPFISMHLADNDYGCVLNKNVFVTKYIEKIPISALSSSEKSCIITVLISPDKSYSITHLWTTAITENVKIYVGAYKPKLFFEFNAKTARQGNLIGLYSNIYKIEIPKKAALFIVLESNLEQVESTIYIDQHPFYAIASTLFYQTSKNNAYTSSTSVDASVDIYTKCKIQFTVLCSKFLIQERFYVVVNGKRIEAKAGSSLVFNNQNISFYYVFFKSSSYDSGVQFYIQTISC